MHISKKKNSISTLGHVSVGTGSFIALNKAWYANYAQTRFHLFNDMGEWMQMDKTGHLWTSYQLARASASIWNWTGMKTQKSILLGSLSAFSFQSLIELQDAYSTKWGFSLSDMVANLMGISTFAIQQSLWNEQKISVKFQYFPYQYSMDLKNRKNQLFGATFPEQILKDYNGQTYWLTLNLHSIYPTSDIPKWLNIALGYNARLMLGGRENVWLDNSGNIQNYTLLKRYRRFFLSADIDLTKIQAKNKLLKNVLFAFNSIKFPFPALEWNTSGKIKFHPLH